MFIPEKMKLNRFKQVSLPSARDYFNLHGLVAPASNQYTGDENAPMPQNKVDSINDWMNYADAKAAELEQNQNKEE